MQFPYWNFFTQGVRFLCFGVVIYITCSIVHRYYLDEDVCLVDFKAIDNELEHIPSFSVCFKDPFLDDEQLIKKFGWNSSHYHGFLKGDHFSVKMQQTEYDEVTIDLLDYVEEVYIEWSNKSYALFDQRTSLASFSFSFWESGDAIVVSVAKCEAEFDLLTSLDGFLQNPIIFMHIFIFQNMINNSLFHLQYIIF